MNKKDLLMKRLKEIGYSLENTKKALALLGLGSVGIEIERLDDYSDLDFFAIVKDGEKRNFIENLDWLSNICPISYYFLNSPDGYKLLFEDGVFCEFAVFEAHELKNIPFAEGQIIWNEEGFDTNICKPSIIQSAPSDHIDVNWLVGEAITNLYVGMCRYKRGEVLSATRFIQNYAVDRIFDLAKLLDNETDAIRDQYQIERRFEFRFPNLSKGLSNFIQGYNKCSESTKAILNFLDDNFEVNQAMKKEILNLCD